MASATERVARDREMEWRVLSGHGVENGVDREDWRFKRRGGLPCQGVWCVNQCSVKVAPLKNGVKHGEWECVEAGAFLHRVQVWRSSRISESRDWTGTGLFIHVCEEWGEALRMEWRRTGGRCRQRKLRSGG